MYLWKGHFLMLKDRGEINQWPVCKLNLATHLRGRRKLIFLTGSRQICKANFHLTIDLSKTQCIGKFYKLCSFQLEWIINGANHPCTLSWHRFYLDHSRVLGFGKGRRWRNTGEEEHVASLAFSKISSPESLCCPWKCNEKSYNSCIQVMPCQLSRR